MTVRIEHDSLGPVEVPAEALWGAQTERARRNFPISGERFSRPFLAALAAIKREAAVVNGELGLLGPELAAAIRDAADEVVGGALDEHFPLDIYQTGSGTSTNMNANEVIANRANERLGGARGARHPVHPNDHVNLGQSSNDVIPTAIHVAAYGLLEGELEPALRTLEAALVDRATAFDDVVKIGRTHLADAVPVRLGQELAGHAQQVRHALARLAATKPRLAELALGGTAVGTGLNAHPELAPRVIARLRTALGLPFVPAANRFEALAARDACVELSGALRTVAVSLAKIANDLRWMASGPRCGIGEITLPSLQPGSSIMPGKVNPVLPEALLMVCSQVVGHDAAIAVAGMSGNFELNVQMPLLARNLLASLSLLAAATRRFASGCVAGIEANRERCAELVERSLAMVTVLAPHIGYDAAAALAKEALASGRTVREVCLEHRLLDPERLAVLLDARIQTEGGLVGGAGGGG
jgi:fumarate hydratase class II